MAARSAIAARRDAAVRRIKDVAEALSGALGCELPEKEFPTRNLDYAQMAELEFAAGVLDRVFASVADLIKEPPKPGVKKKS